MITPSTWNPHNSANSSNRCRLPVLPPRQRLRSKAKRIEKKGGSRPMVSPPREHPACSLSPKHPAPRGICRGLSCRCHGDAPADHQVEPAPCSSPPHGPPPRVVSAEATGPSRGRVEDDLSAAARRRGLAPRAGCDARLCRSGSLHHSLPLAFIRAIKNMDPW